MRWPPVQRPRGGPAELDEALSLRGERMLDAGVQMPSGTRATLEDHLRGAHGGIDLHDITPTTLSSPLSSKRRLGGDGGMGGDPGFE